MASFLNPLFNTTTAENATNYIIPDTSLRFKLRVLMTQYSSQEIQTTLRQIFEDDYSYYQTLFAVPVPVVEAAPAPAASAPAPESATEAHESASAPNVSEEPISNSSRIRSDTKIRVIKRPVAVEEPVAVTEAKDEEASVSVISGDKEKKAQMKREQTEKEMAKYKELVSKGVDPETLLTKENLKKWIDVDCLTYAQIARDHVGLSALQVSNIAKGFGFKSIIAKKRAMIIASRK